MSILDAINHTIESQMNVIQEQQNEIERLKKLVEQSSSIAERSLKIAERCSVFLTLLAQSGFIDPFVKKEIEAFLNTK